MKHSQSGDVIYHRSIKSILQQPENSPFCPFLGLRIINVFSTYLHVLHVLETPESFIACLLDREHDGLEVGSRVTLKPRSLAPSLLHEPSIERKLKVTRSMTSHGHLLLLLPSTSTNHKYYRPGKSSFCHTFRIFDTSTLEVHVPTTNEHEKLVATDILSFPKAFRKGETRFDRSVSP